MLSTTNRLRRRHTRLSGLGYTVQYYKDSPPSQESLDVMSKLGNDYELIDRPVAPVAPPAVNWEDFKLEPIDTTQAIDYSPQAAETRVAASNQAVADFTAARDKYLQDLQTYSQNVSQYVSQGGANSEIPFENASSAEQEKVAVQQAAVNNASLAEYYGAYPSTIPVNVVQAQPKVAEILVSKDIAIPVPTTPVITPKVVMDSQPIQQPISVQSTSAIVIPGGVPANIKGTIFDPEVAMANVARVDAEIAASHTPVVTVQASDKDKVDIQEYNKVNPTDNKGVVFTTYQPTLPTVQGGEQQIVSTPTVQTVTSHMLETDGGIVDSIRNMFSKLDLSVLDPRNYVDDIANSTPDTWWIPGIPNWATIGVGIGAITLWALNSGGDMGISSMTMRRRVR